MKKYFQAPWKFKEAIAIVLMTTGLLGAYAVILYFLKVDVYIKASEFKSLYLFAILIGQWILSLLPLLIFTYSKYKFKWQDFGFNKIGILRTIGLVFGAYFLYLGINFIISLIVIYNNLHISGYQIQESILPAFGMDTLGLIVAGTAILILAPFIEEVLFRGFLLRALVNNIGMTWGSILSAFIFALLHLPWSSFIPIFILGLIINSLVIRSKSIWPAIAFHFFNNSITFVFQLLIEKGIITLV